MTTANPHSASHCRGCTATVHGRVKPDQAAALLQAYIAAHPGSRVASDATAHHRLSICNTCPDLRYGTTCRHCGCLVAVRCQVANKACAAASRRWEAEM